VLWSEIPPETSRWLAIAYLFYRSYLRPNYSSNEEFTVQRIDILQHHQGVIDWEELNDEKIDFILTKDTINTKLPTTFVYF